MKKRLQFLALLIGLAGIAHAQPGKLGSWFIYFGNQAINKKWNWHNEAQWRTYDYGTDLEQLLLRTGIGYNLSEANNNILLGYGFIHSSTYDALGQKHSTDEHRIYQQFITKQRFSRFYLQHRYRLEERFIAGDFRMRFRYFLSLNLPLTRKAMDPKTLYLSAYNELFLHADTPRFDRNRLYGALGWVLSPNMKVELGIMDQMKETTSRPQVQIVFFNNIPFSRD